MRTTLLHQKAFGLRSPGGRRTMLNPAVKNKNDTVFHLAAINGTENFYKIPYTVMDVAITSTMLLLQHFKGTKAKFIFTSSSEG